MKIHGMSSIHFNHLSSWMMYDFCCSSHVRFGQCDVPWKGRTSLVRIFLLVHWDHVGVKIHFFATRRDIVLQRWIQRGEQPSLVAPRRFKACPMVLGNKSSWITGALGQGDADFKPLNNNQCKSCDLSFCKVYNLKCPWDGRHGRVANSLSSHSWSAFWTHKWLGILYETTILGSWYIEAYLPYSSK